MSVMESASITLLSLNIIMLGLALFLIRRILQRLKRIEKQETRQEVKLHEATSPVAGVETSPGGAFEMFLDEDPSRLKMPKSEQFKTYRKWRQEKGMNWSNS
jgi:hypothetical protein